MMLVTLETKAMSTSLAGRTNMMISIFYTHPSLKMMIRKASRSEQVEIDKEDDDDDIVVVAANEVISLVRVQTPRIAMVIMFLVMLATEMVKCQPLSNSFVTLINPF